MWPSTIAAGLILLCLIGSSCSNTKPLDEAQARAILQAAKADSTATPITAKTPIDDERSAVQFAEATLFQKYGKESILREHPYNIATVDGYWIMTGTVHASLGGAFEIVFNKEGQILRITHYQ